MPTKKYKILHLDDEDSLRLIVKDELANAGYDAHSLDLKHEGLDWIAKNKPDLVITDVNSADLNGIDFLRMLRADPKTRDTKVMILSGVDELKVAIEAHKLGAVDYMTKPYQLENLLMCIERVLTTDNTNHAASSDSIS